MSMNLRYRYGFYSYKDVLYEVDIYQEGFSGEVQQVGYGESPVEIEWQETDKLEPVQSSSATVQLFSDNDRQFVDLYTVKAGSVRLDVLVLIRVSIAEYLIPDISNAFRMIWSMLINPRTFHFSRSSMAKSEKVSSTQ